MTSGTSDVAVSTTSWSLEAEDLRLLGGGPMFAKRLYRMALVLLAIVVGSAQAEVWRVGPGETFPTITAALQAAGDGDCIIVSAGTYREEFTVGGTAANPKKITLLAEEGPGGTFIDPPLSGGSGIGIMIQNGRDVVVCGFTIRNHSVYGIQSRTSTGTEIHNCVIHDNGSSGVDIPGAYSPNTATIHHNTIAVNTYGIIQDGPAVTESHNNIVVANRTIDIGCYSLGSLGCNLVGNTNCSMTPTDGPLSCADPLIPVGCNISPLFVDFASRLLQLDLSSPAVGQFASCGGVGAGFGPCTVHGCDNAPPLINCPEPITVECSSPSGAVVNFVVTASDETDPSPDVVTDPPSGSPFSLGVTTVHAIAIDEVENTSTCEFAVTVTQGTGRIVGNVTADCPAPGTGLAGVVVDVFDSQAMLLASAPTGANGEYAIAGLPSGVPLSLSIVTPLGYTALNEELAISVPCKSTSTANFMLACLPIVVDPRSVGYWKHQVGIATGGNGHAQVDVVTLCEYLDLIAVHFNDNQINPVIVYSPPISGSCGDKLLVAREVLHLRGAQGMRERARQQLMALLMNVASGNLSLQAVISADGATVSQAITDCDRTIDDLNGDYESAKTIADDINNGRLVPEGVIDLMTPIIRYKSASTPPFTLEQNSPNPFNPVTTIRFSLPSAAVYEVVIFDVRGRAIRRFAGVGVAGAVEIQWNGRDEHGLDVAAGTYTYHVRTAGFEAKRKMTLVK